MFRCSSAQVFKCYVSTLAREHLSTLHFAPYTLHFALCTFMRSVSGKDEGSKTAPNRPFGADFSMEDAKDQRIISVMHRLILNAVQMRYLRLTSGRYVQFPNGT